MTRDDLQEMIEGYIECVLFTADEEIIEPKSGLFDASPYLDRVSPAMRSEAEATCKAFYDANADDLADYPADCAGHDLWHTRNHHGVGFWEGDHCDELQGERLTDAAQALGSLDMYVGDDGLFYTL